MRRFLDRLYAAGGVLAAACLAGIAVVMLAQAAMREFGLLLRGADDIVGWLCAASAFLALAYTFRHGELVRVGILIDRLPAAARRRAEFVALGLAVLVAGYILWAIQRVYLGPEYKGPHPEALTPMTPREIGIAAPLLALAIAFGVYPAAVLDLMSPSVNREIQDLADWTREHHPPQAAPSAVALNENR